MTVVFRVSSANLEKVEKVGCLLQRNTCEQIYSAESESCVKAIPLIYIGRHLSHSCFHKILSANIKYPETQVIS